METVQSTTMEADIVHMAKGDIVIIATTPELIVLVQRVDMVMEDETPGYTFFSYVWEGHPHAEHLDLVTIEGRTYDANSMEMDEVVSIHTLDRFQEAWHRYRHGNGVAAMVEALEEVSKV